jgi:hypothetical protein
MAIQTFNINDFKSEIINNGVLPQNRFIAIFTSPRILGTVDRNLTLRCENASIPGVNFFTSQTVRYGYGQIERRPYLPTFNPITLTFIVDEKSTIINYFNRWTNAIINYNVSSGQYNKIRSNVMPYELNYKDEWICEQMQIYVYDYSNKKQIMVTLFDAYPLTTTDVSLSWGGGSEAMRYNVSLQYTNMTIEEVVPVTLLQEQTVTENIPLNNPAALEDIINSKNVVPTNPFVSQNM